MQFQLRSPVDDSRRVCDTRNLAPTSDFEWDAIGWYGRLVAAASCQHFSRSLQVARARRSPGSRRMKSPPRASPRTMPAAWTAARRLVLGPPCCHRRSAPQPNRPLVAHARGMANSAPTVMSRAPTAVGFSCAAGACGGSRSCREPLAKRSPTASVPVLLTRVARARQAASTTTCHAATLVASIAFAWATHHVGTASQACGSATAHRATADAPRYCLTSATAALKGANSASTGSLSGPASRHTRTSTANKERGDALEKLVSTDILARHSIVPVRTAQLTACSGRDPRFAHFSEA